MKEKVIKMADSEKKGFIKEFKEFVMRGNVIDLAVGVIIGGAFGAIVTALIDNIIQPLINCFGAGDIGLAYQIKEGVEETTINLGAFISAILNFLIIALVIFCIVKAINKARAKFEKEEEEEPTTKTCPYCKSEIDIEATKCPHCTSDIKE